MAELDGEVPSAHVPQIYRHEHDRRHTQPHTIHDEVSRSSSAKQKGQDIQVRHLRDEFSSSQGFQFLPSVTEGRKRKGENSSPPNCSVSPSRGCKRQGVK